MVVYFTKEDLSRLALSSKTMLTLEDKSLKGRPTLKKQDGFRPISRLLLVFSYEHSHEKKYIVGSRGASQLGGVF